MTSITRQLWEKAQAGGRSAYDRLFALHTDRALLFVRARLGPALRAHVDSLDVLQDAYLVAHRSMHADQECWPRRCAGHVASGD